MPRWEYQVIHLNVENPTTPPAAPGAAQAPAPGPGPAPTADAGGSKSPPVFSQEYLQKEFPGFYTPHSSGQQHPAQQLQGFLNGVGQQGWSLIGVFPLGPLLMMIFRRRLSAASPAGEATAASTAAPVDSGPPARTGANPGPDLDALLRRIETLEQRLDPPAQP
jgi:hypothetical protein